MKKLYFILNLQSGKATISSKLAVVIDMFTKAGYEVTAKTYSGKNGCMCSSKICMWSRF